ncbi:hypothetical protein [Streptomyces sp. NPDC004266]|uniref:hypothetical protein n=1 Tax=Streptomyces sp. NPDC004266 TaxID=3364693 RepID=UPI00368157AB
MGRSRLRTLVVDELPEIDGVPERRGRDVLHCPYCHGREVRDLPFGAIAHPAMPAHQALTVSRWSKDVTLFLHTAGGLSPGTRRCSTRPASRSSPARSPGSPSRTTG